jgi:hypothetical protein
MYTEFDHERRMRLEGQMVGLELSLNRRRKLLEELLSPGSCPDIPRLKSLMRLQKEEQEELSRAIRCHAQLCEKMCPWSLWD